MKKFTKEDIKVRLLLLFCWLPVGIIFLVKSKTIKHKVSLGFLYFFLFAIVGLPTVNCVLALVSALADGMSFVPSCKLAIASFLELEDIIGFYFVPMVISLVVHLIVSRRDLKKGTGIEIQGNQDAIRPSNKNGNTVTDHSPLLYGVNNQSNSKQNAYQKAQVLTEREKNFYETIRLIAEKHNLNVSAKMRLADIVNVSDEIQKQSSLWRSNFGKISQKHIDFALQDKTNLEIKLLIEIDDYTHQREDRIERDKFVDSVCEQVNIPILHLYDVIGLEDKIVNILHSDKTEQEM